MTFVEEHRSKSGVVVRSWASDHRRPGSDGLSPWLQALNTSRADGVAGVSLMPDAHIGKGACIGSVVATEDTILPAAVGVDLGCGMTAAPVSLTSSQLPDDLSGVLDWFSSRVPCITHSGQKSQNRPARRQATVWMRQNPIPSRSGDAARAMDQLGTLGRGNHFLEVSEDETGRVWLVLHSGSRGIGNSLASGHIQVAKDLDKSGARGDLASFRDGTPEFDAYIADMNWAQQYAYVNRETALKLAVEAFSSALGTQVVVRDRDVVRCHHNYAVREDHMGRTLWVTRKGAIRARAGDLGIVPGSMGTSTYIVEGLGNPDSFESAAHGAGRVMSRTAARKAISVKALVDAMEGRAWLSRSAKRLLDEAPQAYKDIDQVMAAQSDLCRPVHRLTALVSYKGV